MHLSDLMDATTLLQNFGGWALGGIALIIFIESGVLFPFLPGDSMLVTAAILRDQLGLNVPILVGVAIVAAFLGDQVGFWLGHRFGRKLFKPDAKILITEHLEQAEAFFLKYGPLALVLGRFIPIVRTYIPVAAVPRRCRTRSSWDGTSRVQCCGLSAWSALACCWGISRALRIAST